MLSSFVSSFMSVGICIVLIMDFKVLCDCLFLILCVFNLLLVNKTSHLCLMQFSILIFLDCYVCLYFILWLFAAVEVLVWKFMIFFKLEMKMLIW